MFVHTDSAEESPSVKCMVIHGILVAKVAVRVYPSPKKSSIKSRRQTNRITFREPLERSASKSKSKSSTSSSHAVWHSVSSVEK